MQITTYFNAKKSLNPINDFVSNDACSAICKINSKLHFPKDLYQSMGFPIFNDGAKEDKNRSV